MGESDRFDGDGERDVERVETGCRLVLRDEEAFDRAEPRAEARLPPDGGDPDGDRSLACALCLCLRRGMPPRESACESRIEVFQNLSPNRITDVDASRAYGPRAKGVDNWEIEGSLATTRASI